MVVMDYYRILECDNRILYELVKILSLCYNGDAPSI